MALKFMNKKIKGWHTGSLGYVKNLWKADHEQLQKKLDEHCQQIIQVEIKSSEFRLLPEEITLDIFSRLPVESVLQCRQVCKTWLTLLHLPYFVDMHLRRHHLVQFDDDHDNQYSNNGIAAKVDLGLVFSLRFLTNVTRNDGLYYVEYHDENNIEHELYSYSRLTKINNATINKRNYTYQIVGSCNGLICFSVRGRYRIRDNVDTYDHIYICNPITQEHKRLFDESTRHLPMVSGFGYIPSSKEYKIVRIYIGGEVHVYTLGHGPWRHIGKISGVLNLYSYYLSGLGVFTNGALHWLDYSEMKVLAFNLADEEFNVVLSPPCFLPAGYDSSKHYFRLQELGKCLCVVHQVRGERVDIWSLKKTTSTTTHILKEQEYNSWTWNREFSITWKGSDWNEFEPFALTKSGEILLWLNRNILSRYDPRTETLKRLVDGDGRGFSFFQAIPHVNSFVSLKDIGERWCRKRKRVKR